MSKIVKKLGAVALTSVGLFSAPLQTSAVPLTYYFTSDIGNGRIDFETDRLFQNDVYATATDYRDTQGTFTINNQTYTGLFLDVFDNTSAPLGGSGVGDGFAVSIQNSTDIIMLRAYTDPNLISGRTTSDLLMAMDSFDEMTGSAYSSVGGQNQQAGELISFSREATPIPSVPDAGSTAVLLGAGAVGLAAFRRKHEPAGAGLGL